jgi:hypothetical protein
MNIILYLKKIGAYPESSSNHQKLTVGAASSREIK